MIKAAYEVLQPAGNHSFLVRTFGKTGFAAPYHFHPEFELTWIVKGSGKRYAGNNMADFSEGDLVLLGPEVPHCWKLHPGVKNARSVVIQFTADFLGEGFFSRAELDQIRKLFQRSGSAIQFVKRTPALVYEAIQALTVGKDNFKNLVRLLEILQQLAVSKEYVLLDRQRLTSALSPANQARINLVFAYLVEHFRKEVSLNEAAAIAGMTPNAFCKYFKRITRKTFMETVTDYRVNYATQQLVQSDKTITDICFDSGFGDISHFYKMFRSKMQASPLQYRRQFGAHL
ncbi:AraC family transcriptional regulator [Chitinophaga sp. GCM10012297]|uniref:AraC family transcriptional regulator n=1 Tax=Chitinophaga chungangae TaxID=2821488 RepID=A0ABS3YIC8_9BACT|nr:AraC family transcriptional regulator [Chitinophaga chungangae]MBO9154443.1 AraC family transcriptional regulator [Chitinophaga chungangae]